MGLVLATRPCNKSQGLVVQSLNSPFFPPHIGPEPGRAKEESRITCMRMLRTNQSKITIVGPNHAARVNVSRNAFFSSRSERNIFFDVDTQVAQA